MSPPAQNDAPVAREHDRARVADVRERLRQLRDQRRVERVAPLRPRQRDPEHRAVPFHAQVHTTRLEAGARRPPSRLARVGPVERLRRPSPATALALLATVVALASALHSGRHVWRHLVDQHRVYAAYTDTQRRHAPIDGLGMPSDIFDFYRQYVVPRRPRVLPGARERLQPVPRPTDGLRLVGRYYLLPALQATDLEATRPSSSRTSRTRSGCHVRFLTQQQAGLQPIYVSRIQAP